MIESPFLTEVQAEKHCQCSRWSLHKWRTRKVNPLPFLHMDGKIIYDREVLDEWMRSHSTKRSDDDEQDD